MDNIEALQDMLLDILLRLGIPIHLSGSSYIIEAVRLCALDSNCLNAITKTLYPKIARSFCTKVANIERAIRHAIDISCNKQRITMLNDIFGVQIFQNSDKPSNREFIALLAGKLPQMITKQKK